MEVDFSSTLLRRLTRFAAGDPQREICGLLLGRGARIVAAVPAANVAANPASRFEIDPATLIATHRHVRRPGTLDLLGCYHSHPSGSPDPSLRDAADAAADGWMWLIMAGCGARLWHAVPDGAVHGRFDRMKLRLRTGKRVELARDHVQVRDFTRHAPTALETP